MRLNPNEQEFCGIPFTANAPFNITVNQLKVKDRTCGVIDVKIEMR